MHAIRAILALCAAAALGQRAPTPVPDPYTPDPYGACLPSPTRHRDGNSCVPNPYHRPTRNEYQIYDPTAAYRGGGVYEADPAIRAGMLELEREAALLAAIEAADTARLMAAEAQRDAAMNKLAGAIGNSAPSILKHKDAWPAWYAGWEKQILPLVGAAIGLKDGYSDARCAKYQQLYDQVKMPALPADDFSQAKLARSLGQVDSACAAKGRFAVMGAVDQARVEYADLAGRVYWRDALYRYLDVPPPVPAAETPSERK